MLILYENPEVDAGCGSAVCLQRLIKFGLPSEYLERGKKGVADYVKAEYEPQLPAVVAALVPRLERSKRFLLPEQMKFKDLEHAKNFKTNVGIRSNGCSGLCSMGNHRRSWRLRDRELEAPELYVGPANTTLLLLFVCRAFRMAITPHMTI